MKRFVSSVLDRASLTPDVKRAFLTDDSMALFREAFTSSSVDSVTNYEKLEHTGDSFLNLATALYITERFPDITKEVWTTRIKFFLVESRTLSKIAYENGFADHIRVKTIVFDDEYYLDKTVYSVLEDVVEAFFGAVTIIADTAWGTGHGLDIVKRILTTYFDKIEIPLTVDFLFDRVTVLKEICDEQGWLDCNRIIRVYKDNMSVHRRSAYKGTVKVPLTQSGVPFTIATAVGSTLRDAKDRVAGKAIDILRSDYDIVSRRYTDSPYDSISSDILYGDKEYAEFGRVLKRYLRGKDIPTDMYRTLTSKRVIAAIYRGIMTNRAKTSLVGPVILDATITNFADTIMKVSSEAVKTRFRHNFISGNYISEYVRKQGFVEILSTQYHHDRSLRLMFKTMLGGIYVELANAKYGMVEIYRLLYRLSIYLFIDTPIPIQPKKDPKSQLKDIYRLLRWGDISEGNLVLVERTDDRGYTITVYGFPIGDRKPVEKNKVMLAVASSDTKAGATLDAYTSALSKLASEYKIYSRGIFYS